MRNPLTRMQIKQIRKGMKTLRETRIETSKSQKECERQLFLANLLSRDEGRKEEFEGRGKNQTYSANQSTKSANIDITV